MLFSKQVSCSKTVCLKWLKMPLLVLIKDSSYDICVGEIWCSYFAVLTCYSLL